MVVSKKMCVVGSFLKTKTMVFPNTIKVLFWTTECVTDYSGFPITCCPLCDCAIKQLRYSWHCIQNCFYHDKNSFKFHIFDHLLPQSDSAKLRDKMVQLAQTLFSNRDKNYFNCCMICFLWVVFEAPNVSEIILNFRSLVVTVGLCEVAR